MRRLSNEREITLLELLPTFLLPNCTLKLKKSQYTAGYCIQLKDIMLDHRTLDTAKCCFIPISPTVF